MFGTTFAVALAALLMGGLAAVARYGITLALAGRGSFPWAVFTVNVIGSAIGGAAVGLAEAGSISSDLRLVLLGGLAGGLTTFSTWSVETVQLVLDGRWRTAVTSAALNLVVGVCVAAGAWALTR
jgi:CrcB protein